MGHLRIGVGEWPESWTESPQLMKDKRSAINKLVLCLEFVYISRIGSFLWQFLQIEIQTIIC